MARPRLNCNGLWARIFGKIVRKSQRLKKIAENSEKIVEIFDNNCEKFQKNSGKTYEHFRKPLPPTYKSARNPKSFSSRIA